MGRAGAHPAISTNAVQPSGCDGRLIPSGPPHGAERGGEFRTHDPLHLTVHSFFTAVSTGRQSEPPARRALSLLGRSVAQLFSERAGKGSVLLTGGGGIL